MRESSRSLTFISSMRSGGDEVEGSALSPFLTSLSRTEQELQLTHLPFFSLAQAEELSHSLFTLGHGRGGKLIGCKFIVYFIINFSYYLTDVD